MAYAYSNVQGSKLPANNNLRFFLYSKHDYEFPEFLYPCYTDDDSIVAKYCADIHKGYGRMRDSTVVMAGLARNVGYLVSRVIARMEWLGMMFKDYRIVIYENDSFDDTLEQLLRWQKHNEKVKIIHEQLYLPRLHDTSLERRRNMAYYRNTYLDYIKKHYSNFDYTLVFDLDLLGGWSYDGIANTLGHDDWEAVGSNGLWYGYNGYRGSIHYDAWAFRVSEETPLKEYEKVSIAQNGVETVKNFRRYRGESMLPVKSAFNGLAVYKTGVLLDNSYCEDDCDHPTLHRQIREQGGRVFLNPSQITLYNYPHFYELNPQS